MLLPGSYKGTRKRRWARPRTLLQIFELDKYLKEDELTHFGGKTEDASAPILSAGFWKKGTQIKGKVVRAFQTDNGTCYTLQLLRPIDVNRKHTYPAGESTEKLDKVSVGSLKGFEMALQVSGVPEGKLIAGDNVQVSCTGTSPSGKGNDQVNFDIQIDRDSF